MRVENIALHLITLPPELHRKALDAAALERLAASIRDVGLLHPIIVEPEGDHYVLRGGHRRLEAFRLMRRPTIPANMRDAGAIAHGEILTWTENLEREDLSPIEQAEAVTRMHTTGHLSVGAIARLLKRSDDWVDLRLDLLKVPEHIQHLVHRRELPMAHAVELARVTDEQHRDYLLRYALLSGASHSVIKDWVAQWRLHQQNPLGAAAPLPPIPTDGSPVAVLYPCFTCNQPHPLHELRAAHICPQCQATVLEATSEWRRPLSADATKSEAQEPPRS